MDIESGSFDKATAIRYLAREHRLLVGRVAALESGAPSANMDAAVAGASLYLGAEFSEMLHLELVKAGYLSGPDLRAASNKELRRVPGVGPVTLKKIRAALE